jgi:uncharacterized cupredoxin-like copper-binding protein
LNRKILIMSLITILLAVFLSACGAQAAPQATSTPEQPERVDVTLGDFTVESSITEFQAGKTYEFVITNNGALEHEFRINPPAEEDGMDMHSDEEHDEALLVVDAADLPAGATKTVEFTFPDSAADEELEFSCHTPGHYEAGMKQAIEVSK